MTAIVEQQSLLGQLFTEQQTIINAFFEQIDMEEVHRCFESIQRCQGALFFTGVGKSGIVAQKVAVTLASTGTKAHYNSATDALHGDLGVVSKGDIFIFLSKSGESDELLSLIPCVRNKGAEPICWVSKSGSRIEKACDEVVHLPLDRELCPFDLAPTSSTAIQMIFGDILTVALMRTKNFTLSEYALNHPAGRIGKQITLRVADLMLTGSALPFCSSEDRLVSVLVELSNKRCGCLLVVDEESVMLGIFTDGDLRRSLQAKGPGALQEKLADLMTPSFRSIGAGALAHEAMKLMEADQKHPVTVLPVLDDQCKPVGLIKLHDILQSGL